MLKFGYITELDVSKGMVRVNFTEDGIVSNLLPVSVPASKVDKYSFPFAINEHVWCLMDENCEFGVVGGAIYSQKDKPSSEANKDKVSININNDKAVIIIDRNSGDIGIRTKGKFTFANDSVNLKELISTLHNFIKNIKVNTPAGPSAGLIDPTPVQLQDLQNDIDGLLT